MHIFFKYLGLLKINYNKETIQVFFNYHAYHPSILSISELLDKLKVPNAALRVDKINFPKLPTPFIAKTSSSEGDFCIITKLENENINYINEKNENIHTSINNFYKQYSGIVLVAEPTINSGEENYILNKKKFIFNTIKNSLFILVFFFIINLFIFSTTKSFLLMILLTLFFIGLIISILLIIASFKFNNPFINKFCSTNSGNGCSNILNSKSAYLFKTKISWSEIGLFYAVSTFIFFITSPISSVSILFYINIICLPFTIYSISYQKWFVKQWCIFCLFFQFFLLFQFVFYVVYFNSKKCKIEPYLFLLYLLILFIIICIWYILKPIILKLQQYPKLIKDLKKFKSNDFIFDTILKKEDKPSILNNEYKIILNDINSNYEILIIMNPYCVPCLEKYLLLAKEFLNKDLPFKLSIVFQFDSYGKNIVKSIVATYLSKGIKDTEKCLFEWFNKEFSEYKFFQKYNFIDNKQINDILYNQDMWCFLNEISDTPSIYVNGYKLPSEYDLIDLKYFILESAKNKNG